MKFPLLSGLLGLKSEAETLTDAHMTAAETAIADLNSSKAALSQEVATLTTSLSTAKADLATATASLTTAQADVQTLQKWKDEQAAVDGRESDESNKLDALGSNKAEFEQTADDHIARVKANLGVK